MQDHFVGNEPLMYTHLTKRPIGLHDDCADTPVLEFAFRRILRRGHDPAGNLSHMFSGIGELALQKL
jgi:hypothetical protein